jgi:hypothetical protein
MWYDAARSAMRGANEFALETRFLAVDFRFTVRRKSQVAGRKMTQYVTYDLRPVTEH